MSVRTVLVRLQADASSYMNAMRTAGSATQLIGAAGMVAGGAVVAGLGMAVKKSAEFEKAMSGIQAATQASAGTLDQLRASAMKAGADTQYSATEAANAITEMSKAGVSAKDIMGGGLNGALSLAAAGQLEVADAAGIASVAMTQFTLTGKDLPHVADLLAAGAGKAMGSVQDLGAALNQSGLVASAAGLSIEETTAGLSAFASAGLIGSDAGTSFKSMLQALQGPSTKSSELMAALGINMYDANGNMLGLADMAGQLQTHLGGLTDEQRNAAMATIFGSDAVRAANVLYKEGAGGIADWTKKVDDAGYAQEQAAALTDNLSGDIERLGGSFDTMLITIGSGTQGPLRELVQMLGGVIDGATGLIGILSEIPGPVVVGTAAFAALVLLRGPLEAMFTRLAVSITSTITGLGMATGATSLFGIAAAGAKAAVSGLVTAALPLAGLIAASYAVSQIIEFAHAGDEATDSVKAIDKALRDADSNGARFGNTSSAIDDLKAKIADLEPTVASWSESNRSWFERAFIPVTAGAQGARDSLQIYQDKLADLEAAEKIQAENVGALAEKFKLSKEDVIAFADAHGVNLSGSLDKTIPLFTALTYATQVSGDTMVNGKTATEDFQAGLEDVATAASDSKKQIDLYKTSLDILNGAHITALQAESDFYAALAASDGALKDLNGSVLNAAGGLDVQSEAGRKTFDVLNGVRDAANQYIGTLIEQGATSDEANAKDAELRESFYQTALQMTGSKDAAKLLTDQIYGIPEERTTKINADTKTATDAVAATQAQIDGLHGATVKITATYDNGGGLYLPLTSQRVPGLAEGGYTGPGAKYDPAPFEVHRGEIVWSQADIAAHGGVGAVESLRRSRTGYADGGIVGGPSVKVDGTEANAAALAAVRALQGSASAAGPAGAGGGMSGTWTSIAGIVQAAIPQARINSTYRPGDSGYHGKNKAVDFGFGSGPGGAGSAGLASIARFLYQGYGRSLAEIIYDGIGDNTPDVKNGQDHVYNAATRAEHQNHVHAAVYHRGTDYVPQTGFAYLEKGEAVIPASLNSREFSGGVGGRVGGSAVSVSIEGAQIVGTLDLGGGLEARIDGRIVSALTGATNRGAYNG